MNLHPSLQENTPLNELPYQVARNLVCKLNENKKWICVIERINLSMNSWNRKLDVGEFQASESPSQKLIDELGNRQYTVIVLALLLEDMALFEPLSTVLMPESIKITDWIGEKLNCFGVSLGGDLELKCTANGNPIPSIVWWRDNLPVKDQMALHHQVHLRVNNCSAQSTLKINDMCPEFQGKYFCVAESTDPNTAKIHTKELDVYIEVCRPEIKEQPTNLCRIETQPVVLTCKAAGYPKVEYQWYHNDKKIFDQVDSILTINSCTKEQSGIYKCVVTNSAGITESDEAILTISMRNLLRVEQSKRLKVVEKLAMLIGNSDEVLKKPINDILLLAEKLTSVGFKVIPLINLSADDMVKALEMFSNLLEDAYGLFYYAGHGCQNGKEAVIPLKGPTDEIHCITESYIMEKLMKKNPKLRIVILDMCLKNFESPVDKTYSGSENSIPDINYLLACATSKNLPSYESKNQPNGAYMTELSKYISPECNYTIHSIIIEVSRAISEREARYETLENRRQIPKYNTNVYEEYTFLDTVTGNTHIKNVFNSISNPPREEELTFKKLDGSLFVQAKVKYCPYKELILNSLVMEVFDLNVQCCKLRVDADRDVIGMENTVKATDEWNKFEICNLQKLRSGINLSLFLMDMDSKIVATAETFVPEALYCKAM